MLYELAKLTLQIGSTPRALAGIKDFVTDKSAKGTLLGCWASEIGELNQVAVLRGFSDVEALRVERKRVLESSNPFGCLDLLTRLETDSYAPFPDVPPVEIGAFGPIYEIRTYMLKPGRLPQTIAAWRAALPARLALSRNLIVMHTIDGPPRFTPHLALREPRATRGHPRQIRLHGGMATEGGSRTPRGDDQWHLAADGNLAFEMSGSGAAMLEGWSGPPAKMRPRPDVGG